MRDTLQAVEHWLLNDGWHYAWKGLSAWLAAHGLRILLILGIALLLRHFGMVLLGKIVTHGISRSRRFENDRDRKLRSATIIQMLNSAAKVAIWLIIGTLILSEFGVLNLLAPLLAGAGVLSLLLGFGIQTFVKDFITGVFIVSENQYRVGDIVAITTSVGGTVEGRVINITLRTTELRDEDGAIHFIPNGNITRAANLTLDYAKVNVEVALPIGANFDKAEREINALGQIMSKDSRWEHFFIQAPYYHGVQTFDTDHVTIEVRARTIPAEQWSVSSEIQKRLAQLISDKHFFAETKKSK